MSEDLGFSYQLREGGLVVILHDDTVVAELDADQSRAFLGDAELMNEAHLQQEMARITETEGAPDNASASALPRDE